MSDPCLDHSGLGEGEGDPGEPKVKEMCEKKYLWRGKRASEKF